MPQTTDPPCTNCDDRGCMDCVLRYWHDDCEHTCPMCEPEEATVVTAGDLQEQIAQALYENATYYGPEAVQPPWESRDDEGRKEWLDIAATILPTVHEAQADAWDRGAQIGYDYGRDDERLLLAYAVPTNNPYRATEYETGVER